MDDAEMRARATGARVARLATVDSTGRPRLVPCCFAIEGDVVYTAVDDVKPKSTPALRRLDRIRDHPEVSLLVDHYEDDWFKLWWIRLDGSAEVTEPGSVAHRPGIANLVAKYPQYENQPPPGALITIGVERWTAWP